MANPADVRFAHWHCLRLTRQEYEGGEVDIIRGAFRAAYLSRNGPQGMALFGLWSDDGQIYQVYATPVTERYFRPILDAYSAKPEAPPRKLQAMEFLCGDEAGGSVLVC
jgi:hypothetical protein